MNTGETLYTNMTNKKSSKSLFVLERAHYYREAPQYYSIGIFASVSLAEKFLRSRMILRRIGKEELVPHPYLKKATFKLCEDGYYRFEFNDDGVVTAYRLSSFNVFESEDDLPIFKVATVSGNVQTTYTFKNGKTLTRNKVIKR